jgi:hypothetical protein
MDHPTIAARKGRLRSSAPDPLGRACALAEAIEAAAPEIEAARRIPPDLTEALHRSRLLRMLLPRSVDGDEVDPATYLRTI